MNKSKIWNQMFLSILLIAILSTGMIFKSVKVKAATLCWPVPGHTGLSQGYHDGKAIDIFDGSIAGAKVVAAMGGTVKYVFKCGTQHVGSDGDCHGFGTGIVILGSDNRWYQYAHMQAGSIPGNIYVGANVEAGQQIGAVGTTGNSSGNHLHFGISIGNYWAESGINPQNENYQPAYYNPDGCVDVCQSDDIGTLRIAGWTYDADSPSTQNDVHVYIGSDDDHEIHGLGAANGYRQDVDDVHHCGAYHGFDKTISTNRTGNQRVRVYAINVGGGNNALLYDNTVYIKPDSEAPILGNYNVTDLNEKGYTVTCTWSDNVGVTNVEFPTWEAKTVDGGGAAWYQGTSTEAGQKWSTWTFTFSEAEEGKKYFTHIYASDAAGNRTCFPLTPTTPVASPIETKNDTTAPVFENVTLTQEEEGTVKLSVELSDDVGLGKMNSHEFLYYSMDEDSSYIIRGYAGRLISQNINCWQNSGNSNPIMEKDYTVEQTTSVQCDSIVSYALQALDLSGNYAVGNPPYYNDNGIYNIRSDDIKGEENRSIEITIEKGEEVTLGTIREKLSQLHKLDTYIAYYDDKNSRILKKSNSFANTFNNREEEKKVVLTANEAGTEYVYFVGSGSGDVYSCKIKVTTPEQMGDVYQDGKIDGKDVSLLLQYRLKKRELTEEQIAAGDVYADGKIDGKDVSKLLQYRLGKIDSLE